ncbi:Bsp6I family type II restriction endonuclease [Anaerofustis sp. LCP19S3_F7]|uniref:Bsp6I family type II restriction endonuclease n=1 Tax=Anaerofustis sp. LCP19S3_F7 TaxID=3440247 RepID=UPI003F91ACC8
MVIYNEFGHIKIDEARIDETCNAYFKWKDLNTYISNNSHRGINMPDAISEPMGCYCLNYLWNRGDESGDATDPETGEKIEFKATSRFDGDLSSFGPKCKFDNLVFLRFKLDDNLLYIYNLKINSEDFGRYPANKKETIQDQKNQGRRPHVSLQKLFVEEKNLDPDIIFDIRKCKAYNRLSKEYNRFLNK